MLKNERGYSFIESLLALQLLTLLVVTMIPFFLQMHHSVQQERHELLQAKWLYKASQQVVNGETSGVLEWDGNEIDWWVNESSLCIRQINKINGIKCLER